MVKGIDQFKAHFAGFTDRYVLIGSAACYLAMEELSEGFQPPIFEYRVDKPDPGYKGNRSHVIR